MASRMGADIIESLDDKTGVGGGGTASIVIIATSVYSGYLLGELFSQDLETLSN